MSHHDHHAPSASDDSLVGMLSGFFPAKGELTAFVGGLALGVVILGVLAALGVAIEGHLGLWRSF